MDQHACTTEQYEDIANYTYNHPFYQKFDKCMRSFSKTLAANAQKDVNSTVQPKTAINLNKASY